MKYLDNLSDNVKQYITYLGIVFNSSGSFTMARKEILNKGMKALFKFRKKHFHWIPQELIHFKLLASLDAITNRHNYERNKIYVP